MSALQELRDALVSLGLSDNAIRFFLESYRTGPSSVGALARAMGMDRSSAYLAYEQLKAVALLEEDLAGTRRKVWAKAPSAVLARLRVDIRRMRRQVEALEEASAVLLAGYVAQDKKPVLQFFSGKEGLRRISDDVLGRASEEILLLSNFDREREVFSSDDHQEFIRERVRRGIYIRVLATDSQTTRNMQCEDSQFYRETRIVPKDSVRAETYVYENSVAMLSYDTDIIGFIVRSDTFAEAQRFMFNQLWKAYEVKNG